MTLAELLELQRENQRRAYGVDPRPGGFASTDEAIEYFRMNALATVAELVEVLNEVGWKPWKQRGYGVVNAPRVRAELADVLLFVANLALMCGVDGADLADEIRSKIDENRRRQEAGY